MTKKFSNMKYVVGLVVAVACMAVNTPTTFASNPAPTVLSTTPTTGATSVSRSGNIVIVFSEAMNTGSLDFTPSPVGTFTPVWSTTTFSNDTVTLTHTSNQLYAGRTYTATIGTGTQESGGVAIAAPYSWTFRTQAAASYQDNTSSTNDTTNSGSSSNTTTPPSTPPATPPITPPVTPPQTPPVVVITTDAGCVSGALFSSITGNACTSSTVSISNSPTMTSITFDQAVSAKSGKSKIMDLQKVLNAALTSKKVLKVDGKWGAKTVAAIKAFQLMNHISATGSVGVKTRAALSAVMSAN